MTISDYIQAIVTELFEGAHYEYGRNADFNITGDNTPSPAVLCIEPDQQFLNMSALTGNVGDGYNLFIRFLQLIPTIGIGDAAASRVQAITDQKLNAAKFISQLSEDDLFLDLNATIPIVTIIEAYDGNWFGVEINLRNLQVAEPLDTCPL